MRTKTLTVSTLVLTFVLLGLSLWFLTADVYADQHKQYSGESAPGESRNFCGSAYDVVLLKGDGFMGGEVPVNQAVLDKQCVEKAGRSVAIGSALAGAGVVVGLLALGSLRLGRDTTASTDRSDDHAVSS